MPILGGKKQNKKSRTGPPQEREENKEKKKFNFDISLGRVSTLEKALFAKYLSVMIKSGLTLVESLDISQDQAKGKMKKVLADVYEYVNRGHPLAEALERHKKTFPNIFINLIRTGEKSGTLAENLMHLSDQTEKDLTIRRKVRSAMMYPVFVLVAACGLGFAMAIFVLPQITKLFRSFDVELPLSTRVLLWIADWFSAYGWQTFVGFVVFVIAIAWILRLRFIKPATHWIILHLPVIGRLSHNVNLARFCRTLGVTLRSGLTIDDGLKISADVVENYRYKKALAKVAEDVQAGKGLSESLEKHEFLFPKITTRMAKVGESTGTLEEVLLYLAEFYEAEVDNTVKNLATILEPVLLVAIGLVVGGLALSIITPIYQLSGSIGRG